MNTDVRDNWYETFFTGINCAVWEKAIPPDVTTKEVDFVVAELGLSAGDHILDIPCGYGRHAIPIAQRGYMVTGVDISERFMQLLNKNIEEEQLPIHAIQADVLSVELKPEQFAGAVCLGNSFGYFNREKMKVFVKTVAGSLRSGAKLIVNSGMLAESILPNLVNYAKNKTYVIDDITMVVNNTYCVNDSYLVSNLHFTQGGVTEEHSFKHFVFTLGEVKWLLKQYGVQTMACYNGIDGTPYSYGDPQVYIVAVKE